MEGIKRSADFAESQIRVLLNDLNNDSHNIRTRAIKRFQEYIATYRPEMYDDDADTLLLGSSQRNLHGLLYWSGAKSSKHGGQLKRIASSVISLLRWLVTLDPDGYEENIYYDRFTRLTVEQLQLINFPVHILATSGPSSNSRFGSAEDAFELLSVVMQDHLSPEGEPEPIDINTLLCDNVACRDKFMQWLQVTSTDQLAEARDSRGHKTKDTRPTSWDKVKFTPVPLQEDEEGFITEAVDATNDDIPVPDPLGLRNIDLRSIQAMHHSGPSEAMSNVVIDRRTSTKMNSLEKLSLMKRLIENISTDKRSSSATEKKTKQQKTSLKERKDKRRTVRTAIPVGGVIPSTKDFSPGLFLSLVHGSCTLQQLSSGLRHLQEELEQQSQKRQQLVRQHYGLFIHCSDGIEWIKSFQSGNNALQVFQFTYSGMINPETAGATSRLSGMISQSKGIFMANGGTGTRINVGKNRTINALKYLQEAKQEAQNTLAPILIRMKNSRQLKNAEVILLRLLTTLQLPHTMQVLLNRGEYESVLTLYRRVVALPAGSSLRILTKIKEKSAAIIEDMKQQLTDQLLSNEIQVPTLVRLIRILQEMETENSFHHILQTCYQKQVKLFQEQLTAIEAKYLDDVVAAYLRGQELNLVNRDTMATIGMATSNSNYDENAYFQQLLQTEEENSEDESSVAETAKEETNDPTVDYCHVLCCKERVKYVSSVVQVVEQWLPCIHRVVLLLKQAKTPSGSRTAANKMSQRLMHLQESSSQSPSKLLSEILVNCSKSIHEAILGYPSTSGAAVGEGKNIFQHELFRNPLQEPFLSITVIEVSELYDVIEAVLTSRSIDIGSHNYQDEDMYKDAIAVLRVLSEDGEQAIVKRTMDSLRNAAVALLKSSESVENIVSMFEKYVIKTINHWSRTIKRPEWVSKTIWDGIASVVEVFMDGLVGAEVQAVRYKKTRRASSVYAKAPGLSSDASIIALRRELDALEGELRDDASVTSDAKLLEFIKATLHIKQEVTQKIWNSLRQNFPLESSSVNAKSNFYWAGDTPTPNGTPMQTRRKSRSGVEGGSNAAEPAPQTQDKRLSALSNVSTDPTIIEEKIVSVILESEDKFIRRLIDVKTISFRTSVHAAYSVIVKVR